MREKVVQLRRRNQLTWPLAVEMGLQEGTRLVVVYDREADEARVASSTADESGQAAAGNWCTQRGEQARRARSPGRWGASIIGVAGVRI
jgi:hypothetical protein